MNGSQPTLTRNTGDVQLIKPHVWVPSVPAVTARIESHTREKHPRFTLIHANRLDSLPALEWLIPGEIPVHGLSGLIGPSGVGKSFLALEYALRAAQENTVIYVAAEGASGYQARVKAWCMHHDADEGHLYFCAEAVNLMKLQEVDAFLGVLSDLNAKPALVVIDTLARCMVGGDENSAKDMGLAIAACDRIRQRAHAAVLVVHHTGKGGDYRGSSALKGALDTMIELKPNKDLIEVSCAKSKDAKPFDPRFLRITQVVNTDSCVLTPLEHSPTTRLPALPRVRRKILEFLSQSKFEETGARSADIESAALGNRSDVFQQLKELKLAGLIRHDRKGDPYCITDKGRAALATNPMKPTV